MSQCFVKGQTLLYDIYLHDMVLIWVAAEHVYYNNKTCVGDIVVMAPVCTSALNEVMLLCLFLLYLCLFTTEQTELLK